MLIKNTPDRIVMPQQTMQFAMEQPGPEPLINQFIISRWDESKPQRSDSLSQTSIQTFKSIIALDILFS